MFFFVVRCQCWGFSSTLPPFTRGGGRKSANKYGSEWMGNETGEVNSSQLLPRQQKQHCNGQIIGCGLRGWTSYYILFFSIFLHFFISSLLPLISHLPFFLPYPCSRGKSPSLKAFSSRSSEGKKYKWLHSPVTHQPSQKKKERKQLADTQDHGRPRK